MWVARWEGRERSRKCPKEWKRYMERSLRPTAKPRKKRETEGKDEEEEEEDEDEEKGGGEGGLFLVREGEAMLLAVEPCGWGGREGGREGGRGGEGVSIKETY